MLPAPPSTLSYWGFRCPFAHLDDESLHDLDGFQLLSQLDLLPWRGQVTESRVITPDQIGFCKSSKPPHYQFTFDQLAANTRALLASLDIERSMVIGHRAAAAIPGAHLIEFEDLGHSPQVQDAERFNAALIKAMAER